jgi:hypothetical protein
VRTVVFDGDRPVAAEWTHQDQPDTVRTVSFDFLVDASGRTGVLARKHFDMRTPHELFQNVGVWGYWTGVHLAQYSAMVGAAAVATWLRGDMPEPEVLAFFDYTYRRAYSRMLALVSRMYQEYIGMDDYFGQSQHLVHADGHGERPVRSFTQIVTGLTDVREAAGTTGRAATEAIADAAGVKAGYMGGIDMSSVWNIWRDPLGPDTAMGDIRVMSQPWLGLYGQTSGSER